ncbi:MAG: prolipoprotein diacylglyceryl transferase [Phycisphaerales bacterium]|nr:prolipoprotein diacylglyceryl transferase [Phycisphaerales bacterium]
MDHAWLHNLDPVILRISGELAVRWYGVSYLAGFVIGWFLLRRLAKKGGTTLSVTDIDDLIMSVVVGVIIGGRLGYAVFYDPSLLYTFSKDVPFWELFRVTNGGMASHGGMIGVVIAGGTFFRRFRRVHPSVTIPVWHILDLLALAAPIGLGLGRVANFINGELLGKIVAMPGEPAPWWAVRYPQEILTKHDPGILMPLEARMAREEAIRRLTGAAIEERGFSRAYERVLDQLHTHAASVETQLRPLLSARHPSQVYQALAEGLVLGVALWIVYRATKRPGIVSACFLMIYGMLRIVTEFWRLPDAQLAVQRVLGLSRGQWLSAVMVALGVGLYAYALVKLKPIQTSPAASG